jgi:hypothetical protein
VQKCDEYHGEIERLQLRIIQMETRIDQRSDDSEVLILFIKGAVLQEPSKNRFHVSLSQPLRSQKLDEDCSETEAGVSPSVIIDNTQQPPVFISTPKGKKKFSLPFVGENQAPSKSFNYQEKIKSANKPSIENLVIGVKI